jgi:hypothetical protein
MRVHRYLHRDIRSKDVGAMTKEIVKTDTIRKLRNAMDNKDTSEWQQYMWGSKNLEIAYGIRAYYGGNGEVDIFDNPIEKLNVENGKLTIETAGMKLILDCEDPKPLSYKAYHYGNSLAVINSKCLLEFCVDLPTGREYSVIDNDCINAKYQISMEEAEDLLRKAFTELSDICTGHLNKIIKIKMGGKQ